MQDVLSLAAQNLLSPIVLFFVLGVGAALARSDLTIPEAVAKGDIALSSVCHWLQGRGGGLK